MADEHNATSTSQDAAQKPKDFSNLDGHQQLAADESTWQKIKRNLTSYDPTILPQKMATGQSPQEEGEEQYRETFGTPLERAYGKLKSWLSEHEGKISEKYLAPFRQGLDNMAADLGEAAETGHTKSGGQLTPTTRALAGGVATALKAVPVGHDVPETLAATITPPEVKPEALLAEKGLDFSKLEGHTQVSEPTHGKVLYHGTKAPIKEITEADPVGYGDPSALAGIGMYLTDKPEVASGYAMGKKAAVSEGGRVLAGRLRKDAKVLDLEKPASPEIRETFAKEIRHVFPDLKISDSEIDNEYFRAPGDKPSKKITGTDLFDGLRRAMIEAGYPSSEATEVMQNIAIELKHTHGYDALRYEGGKRIPTHGPHEVHVVLPDMLTGRVPEGMIKSEVPSKSASAESEQPKAKNPRDVIESQGLKYKGELTKGSGVHMFEHPDHPGWTAALDENKTAITPQNIQAKMKDTIQKFIAGEARRKASEALGAETPR
jgi:hypothetical protein